MIVLGWTRLILMHDKTVPVVMRTLESLLGLKFEFEDEAGREFRGPEMSNEKLPNLILLFSSRGTDFLTGES
jgi:hypothetical protein